MSKLAYSPQSLRRRMLMARTARLLVIVEGRNNDRWYYDNLCRQGQRMKEGEWLIWEVEQFTRNQSGTAASGRSAVINLHDDARKNNYLTVRSRSRACSALFCVDADLDRLIGGMRLASNLYYTYLPDSEAEALYACDLPKMVAALTSIPIFEAKKFVSELGDFVQVLAGRLESIIALHCAAHRVSSTYRPALPRFSDLITSAPPCCDPQNLAQERTRVCAGTTVSSAEFEKVEQELLDKCQVLASKGKARNYLKGKWLFAYLFTAINEYLAMQGRSSMRGKEWLPAAIRASAQITSARARRFTNKLDSLLA